MVLWWCFCGGVSMVVFLNIAQSSIEVMVNDSYQISPKVLLK